MKRMDILVVSRNTLEPPVKSAESGVPLLRGPGANPASCSRCGKEEQSLPGRNSKGQALYARRKLDQEN